jgi:hypothetical protein
MPQSCAIIKLYPGCAVAGHLQQGSRALLGHRWCDEAKANGSFGNCGCTVHMETEPDFTLPCCDTCESLEAELRKKVSELVAVSTEARRRGKEAEGPILAEDFFKTTEVGRAPTRTPTLSLREMMHFISQYLETKVAEMDLMVAESWVKTAVTANFDSTEQFVRFIVASCQLRYIEAAIRIAQGEDDQDRLEVLQILERSSSQKAVTYRSRLEYLGVWTTLLEVSGFISALSTGLGFQKGFALS